MPRWWHLPLDAQQVMLKRQSYACVDRRGDVGMQACSKCLAGSRCT